MKPWQPAQGREKHLMATPPLGQLWLLSALFCLALSGMIISEDLADARRRPVPWLDGQHLGLLLMMLTLSLALVPALLSRLPGMGRVLRQRRAPGFAFERGLRRASLSLLASWLLMSLPLAIEAGRLDPAALAMAGAGPACLALTLSGSLWAFAAWHGWIARGWLLPLPLLLMLPGWLGLASVWRAWRDAGWPLHLAGCALLLFSLWRLNSQLATRNVSPDSPARWLVAWRRSGLARWRLLDPRGYTTFVALMPQLLLPTLSKGSSNALLIQAWGTPLDMWHGLRMLFFTAMLVGMLGSRDLHWRWLLAPQGRFRAGLALRVARDSWLPLAAAVGLISLLACAVQVLILKRPAGQALPALLTISLPLLCDFSLALMLALLLRGWFSTTQIAGSLIAVGLVMSCLLWSMWSSEAVQQPLPSWIARGWFSCLLELALAAALLRWAQAVWARKDLHELLRATQVRPRTG